jgi:hypothetical protein
VARFSGFEDAQLEGRLARSKRAEQDLQERVAKRISDVNIEGRWLRSDPLYQRLSSILSQVSEDIKDAEHELSRRGRHPSASRSPSVTDSVRDCD